MAKQHDPRDYDPTWHSALDDARRACIGGRWCRCEIQPRRTALKALMNKEEPAGHEATGLRVRRRSARSRLNMYQRRRSGVANAFRRAFVEANQYANPALVNAFMAANRTLFN